VPAFVNGLTDKGESDGSKVGKEERMEGRTGRQAGRLAENLTSRVREEKRTGEEGRHAARA